MSRDHVSRSPALLGVTHGDREAGAGAVGKRTLVEAVQRIAASTEAGEAAGASDDVKTAAVHGTSGPAVALPHGDRIQRLFGRHDVSGIRAHVGGAAAEGAAAMGAEAFATGDRVAFGWAPDLHTAAHEAAHVVQQRAGVHLKGGVGQAGDAYERHADAVADRVVQGESAEPLLDQMGPGVGGASGAGAGAAAPVQRLQTRINGQVEDITKADLHNAGAIDALFGRLHLVLPASVPNNTFSRVNKISAAIDVGAPNAQIFLDVLGAINDGRAPSWDLWDANELNLGGPAHPSTRPGGSVERQLQDLVNAGRHQDAVTVLRQRYRPAAAVGYTIRAVDKFVMPSGEVIENDAYANVAAGQTVIDLSKRWIERFILSGQIANLVNVIEHEATHVKQNTGAAGVTNLDDEDVREFEAYCREIQVTIQRAAFDEHGHLATSVEFEKAVAAATKHRDRALAARKLVSRHTAQWAHIQAALPATRARLAETDRTRDVYARDRGLLQTKLARHHDLYVEMSGLYQGDPGAAERAATLTKDAEDLQVLHVLQRLPPAYTGSPAVATYHREHEAFLDFIRLRRLPRRPQAQSAPTTVAATGAIPLLAPPQGDRQSGLPSQAQSTGGTIPLLAPPLGDRQSALPSQTQSTGGTIPLLAPPPGDRQSAPPSQQQSSGGPASLPPTTPSMGGLPASTGQPSGESAVSQAAPQAEAEEDDEGWSDFQSAPSGQSPSSGQPQPRSDGK